MSRKMINVNGHSESWPEGTITPREMRETVERMNHLDLILLDTAGRSPKDEIRLQELNK